MTPAITACCPLCEEDVHTDKYGIRLRVCCVAPLSYYTFTCPDCGPVQKPADDRVISLLMSGGVRAEVWEIPAEAMEPHTGPRLTSDDLLDLCLDLEKL